MNLDNPISILSISTGAKDEAGHGISLRFASAREHVAVSHSERPSRFIIRSQGAALLCGLVTVLAILATHPTLNMGTSDDWSYALTSLEFLRTGHIVYNGWATAMLGWQILWGALIIKLFGFSFLALRLSTLPFAMGAAYLLHRVGVRMGLTAKNATLATLTVVLSPLFLPLAASFMTDIPAFFWLLAGLYACLRSISASTGRACLLWLTFASITNVAAGSARQVIWLIALAMVPSVAWLQRKRPGVLIVAGLLWLASVIAIAGCLHWFYQEPYSIPEKIIAGQFTLRLIPHILQQMRDMTLSILLLSLPALSAFVIAWRLASKKIFLVSFGLGIVFLVFRMYTHGASAFAPWMPNIVTEYGVGGSGSWESLGQKPVVLQPWVRALVTSGVLIATCAWLATWLPRILSREQAGAERQQGPSWLILSILLGPFSAAYLALLMPRAIFGVALDRYLLPMMAVFCLLLLRFFQDVIRAQASAICFAVAVLFGSYGVAATHDYFATGRARLEAASLVEAAGVPRTQIQGGWEYDGWTQITTGGYINDSRLVVPAGAYHPSESLENLPEACRFSFARLTPVIDPRYFVVFSPQRCLAPSKLGPVTYRTWLPPFSRSIYIQQLPSSN